MGCVCWLLKQKLCLIRVYRPDTGQRGEWCHTVSRVDCNGFNEARLDLTSSSLIFCRTPSGQGCAVYGAMFILLLITLFENNNANNE